MIAVANGVEFAPKVSARTLPDDATGAELIASGTGFVTLHITT
jgi:hypothetical protein